MLAPPGSELSHGGRACCPDPDSHPDYELRQAGPHFTAWGLSRLVGRGGGGLGVQAPPSAPASLTRTWACLSACVCARRPPADTQARSGLSGKPQSPGSAVLGTQCRFT